MDVRSRGDRSMRKRFSDEEWRTLRLLPVNACILVAKEVSNRQKGIDELSRRVNEPCSYEDPLHGEISADISGADLVSFLEGASKLPQDEPATTRERLRKKLTQPEYQSFVTSMFVDQWKFAMTCDSDLNQGVLNHLYAFALFWSIDLTAVPVEQLPANRRMRVAKWLKKTAEQIRTIESIEEHASRLKT
jgi:hypothetical protein